MGNQNLSVCVFFIMNPIPTVFKNLKLGRSFWIIFWVLWQMFIPKSCICKFITTCLDYPSFEFLDILWRYLLSIYLHLQILQSNDFSKEHQHECNFGGSLLNYLTTLEAFWTSILHSFRSAVLLSQETYPRTYSIVPVRCLWSLFLTFVWIFLTFAMFMKLSFMIVCIRSIELG